MIQYLSTFNKVRGGITVAGGITQKNQYAIPVIGICFTIIISGIVVIYKGFKLIYNDIKERIDYHAKQKNQ